jgi:hypothetical protein
MPTEIGRFTRGGAIFSTSGRGFEPRVGLTSYFESEIRPFAVSPGGLTVVTGSVGKGPFQEGVGMYSMHGGLFLALRPTPGRVVSAAFLDDATVVVAYVGPQAGVRLYSFSMTAAMQKDLEESREMHLKP